MIAWIQGDYQVDPLSERLIVDFGAEDVQYFLIDLDTTLGELQQTLDSSDIIQFNYNVTSVTNGTTDIYMVIFDDEVRTEQFRIGPGTAVSLVENGNPQGFIDFIPTATSFLPLFDNTNAGKNIGYVISSSNTVTFSSGEQYPISLDFNTFDSSAMPINHISRTSEYPIPQAITPEPEPPGLTQERLAALIEVRNLALEQQNYQINYWSDPTNPFADDMVMAQKQLNNANYHISITTMQRDSYQTELDGLTG